MNPTTCGFILGYTHPEHGALIIALAYCLDAIYLTDVIITFRSAVYTPNGKPETVRD